MKMKFIMLKLYMYTYTQSSFDILMQFFKGGGDVINYG